MKISMLRWMTMAAFLIGLVAMNAKAQEYSSEHLVKLNKEIGDLLIQMNERAEAYPQTMIDVKEHSKGIEKAGEEVQKMLDDLRLLTNKMDVNSEYHEELNSFERQTSNLIAKVKAKSDPSLQKPIEILENQLGALQSIDRRRATAVIQARNVIRSLEDYQENLVLIMQIGHIDAAIEIFESSLGEFEGIVNTAQEIQAEATRAISTP